MPPTPLAPNLASLIPRQQLEPMPERPPGTWRSRGVDPQFVARCHFHPGWLRVRLRMACAVRARVEVYVDTGGGWDAARCIERTDFRGRTERDFFLHCPHPVRGVRLDPLD